MRILIVEDEPRLSQVLAQALREHGYAIDLAHDGEEGLGLAELEPYDALILDVMLPRLDGFELCRRLRTGGSAVPILMLTARDAVEDRVRGLDLGADDYLIKPFSLSELLARIRALFRRQPAGSREPLLRVGALELDPGTREVRRGGQPVTLTSKEFSLLEYLLRNPGRVLSRDSIVAHVWDYDFSATSNVVDVYIRSLRRKLEDNSLIRTIRGAGYKLQP